MATESPLIHDGAQCVAAANYWNPSTALAGANGSGQFLGVYVSGTRTVTLDTSGGTNPVYGILQNTPAAGLAADVGILGISKAVAGAQLNAGAQLQLDSSSRVITATSTNHRFAIALEAAGAAGQVITILITGDNTTA